MRKTCRALATFTQESLSSMTSRKVGLAVIKLSMIGTNFKCCQCPEKIGTRSGYKRHQSIQQGYITFKLEL